MRSYDKFGEREEKCNKPDSYRRSYKISESEFKNTRNSFNGRHIFDWDAHECIDDEYERTNWRERDTHTYNNSYRKYNRDVVFKIRFAIHDKKIIDITRTICDWIKLRSNNNDSYVNGTLGTEMRIFARKVDNKPCYLRTGVFSGTAILNDRNTVNDLATYIAVNLQIPRVDVEFADDTWQVYTNEMVV